MLDALSEMFAKSHPALVPTRRLAHTLRREYNTTMRAKLGDTGVWRTTDITTVDAWLLRLAELCLIDDTPLERRQIRVILDAQQECKVWGQIIRSDSVVLQRPCLAATVAMDAHVTLLNHMWSSHAE